jgi:mRNA interferase MazF
MSTKIKGYPFEVLAQVDGMDCVILSDQIKSLDWKIRLAKNKATVSADVMLHVRAKMQQTVAIVSMGSARAHAKSPAWCAALSDLQLD